MFFLVSLLARVDASAFDMDLLLIILPESVYKVLDDAIFSGTPINSNITLITILVMMWSASNSIFALMKGVINTHIHEKMNITIRTRAVAVIFTIGFAVSLMITFASFVAWDTLTKLIYTNFGIEINSFLVTFLRNVLAAAVIFLFSLALYYFALSRKIKIKDLWRGAVYTGAMWIVASHVFEIYINNFSKYSVLYGSVGTFLGMVIWLFVISLIILTGAEINALFVEIYKEKCYD